MLQSVQEQEAELEILLQEIEALGRELAATRRPPVLHTWLYWLYRTAQPAVPWIVSCVVVPCLFAVWSVVLPHVFGRRQTLTPRVEEGMTVPSKKVLLRGETGTMHIGTTSALPGRCVEVDGNGTLVPLPTSCSTGGAGSGAVTTVGTDTLPAATPSVVTGTWAFGEDMIPVMHNGQVAYCPRKAPSDDASDAVCYHVTDNGGGWTIITPTGIANNLVYGPSQGGIRLSPGRAPSFANNVVSAPVSPPAP
jgi:hypothetical protein